MNFLSKALVVSQLCSVATSESSSIRGGRSRSRIGKKEKKKDRWQQKPKGIFDTRIINGAEANEGRYSYAVSLSDDIGHFCGGSLIAKDVVLSAAHCAGGGYHVVVGRHDLRDESDGEEITVDKELVHPDYDTDSTDNDFMLVFLDSSITENVNLVRISSDFIPEGEKVTVMGWGDTHISDEVSRLADELQEVEVTTITNAECDASEGTIGGWDDNYNEQISDNMLCAEHAQKKDACQGDSGGPLVIKGTEYDTQVGVVSWGIGCAHDSFPGVCEYCSSSSNCQDCA
jgi:trypsin